MTFAAPVYFNAFGCETVTAPFTALTEGDSKVIPFALTTVSAARAYTVCRRNTRRVSTSDILTVFNYRGVGFTRGFAGDFRVNVGRANRVTFTEVTLPKSLTVGTDVLGFTADRTAGASGLTFRRTLR